MISSETTFQSPQPNNHAITPQNIITYTWTHCDSFVIALYLLYKYPIYAINRLFPDEDGKLDKNDNPIEERAESVHYVNKRKELFLDVEGEHKKADLIQKYRSHKHESTGTRLDLVSISEVMDMQGLPTFLEEATLLILRDQAFYE